jgi:hypothetical protein
MSGSWPSAAVIRVKGAGAGVVSMRHIHSLIINVDGSDHAHIPDVAPVHGGFPSRTCRIRGPLSWSDRFSAIRRTGGAR